MTDQFNPHRQQGVRTVGEVAGIFCFFPIQIEQVQGVPEDFTIGQMSFRYDIGSLRGNRVIQIRGG